MPKTTDVSHNGDKLSAESSCNWTRRQLLARLGKLTAATVVSTIGWGIRERAAAQQSSPASVEQQYAAPSTSSPGQEAAPVEPQDEKAAPAEPQDEKAAPAESQDEKAAPVEPQDEKGKQQRQGEANGGGCMIIAAVVCGSAAVLRLAA